MAIDEAVRGKIQADYGVASERYNELETARKEFKPEGEGDVVTCATVTAPSYLRPTLDEGQQVPYEDPNCEYKHWENVTGLLRTVLSDGIAPAGLLDKLEEVPDYVANLSNAPTE